jgi:hypothetical protein
MSKDFIYINSTIKDSTRNYVWYNIISAKKGQRPTVSAEWSDLLKREITKYTYVDDYIIEYKIIFEKENGEKDKTNDFIYTAFLSEFHEKEKEYITELLKLSGAIVTAATESETVIVENTIVD